MVEERTRSLSYQVPCYRPNLLSELNALFGFNAEKHDFSETVAKLLRRIDSRMANAQMPLLPPYNVHDFRT